MTAMGQLPTEPVDPEITREQVAFQINDFAHVRVPGSSPVGITARRSASEGAQSAA